MSDGKRPTKGTLRLAPRADKPAGAPSKAPSAKSGARRAAAAAARGERLRPAAPLPKGDDGERRRRSAGASAGKRSEASLRAGRSPDTGRKPGGEGRPDGRSGVRDKSRQTGAGDRGEREAANRGGERRPGRPAPAGDKGDKPWGARPNSEGNRARPDSGKRPGAAPRRTPAVTDPTAPDEGMDVWAQARANLAARARQSAGVHAPSPAKEASAPGVQARPAQRATDGASDAAPAVRATPDHPLYDPSGVRVSKLLAEQGLCSRREADSYIERGWVLVDGQRVTELGLRVSPGARVTLAPEASAVQTQQVTILLHKPVGYVSGQPEPGYAPAASLIGPANQMRESAEPVFHPGMLKGLAPAGRLDIDSTGLLVLTQDGRVARQLIGDDSQVEKEYIVRVEGALIDNGLALLNHGLSLDDQPLRPARVEWINDDQLRFVLREGRKRQIRRMCELVGLHVVGLKRVRIGQVRLGDLPAGCWRLLRAGETF